MLSGPVRFRKRRLRVRLRNRIPRKVQGSDINHFNLRQILASDWFIPGAKLDCQDDTNALPNKGIEAVVKSIDSWYFKAKCFNGAEVLKAKEG